MSKIFKYFLFIISFFFFGISFSCVTNAANTIDNLISYDLYNSYYYEQLSDESKVVYDGILDNIKKTCFGTSDIKIDVSTHNIKMDDDLIVILQSAIDAFDRDHPEVFWLDINKIEFKYSVKTVDDNTYVDILYIGYNSKYSNYLIDSYNGYDDILKDAKLINESLIKILPYINSYTDTGDNYKKIKYIHDYLVLNNEYNRDLDNASPKALKAIGAFPGNNKGEDAPICEGYSRAFKLICDKAGIPCVIVSGVAGEKNNQTPHMWNYIYLDEFWYGIDCTWDDPIITNGTYEELSDENKYAYFLVGSDTLFNTHTENNNFINSDTYEYYFEYPLLSDENYVNSIPGYKILIANVSGGRISVNVEDLDNVSAGTVIKINIHPDDGMEYINNSIKINKENYSGFTFIMPSYDVYITASFTPIKKDEEVIEPTIKPTTPPVEEDDKKEPVPTKKPVVNEDNKNEDVTQPPVDVEIHEDSNKEYNESSKETNKEVIYYTKEELELALKNNQNYKIILNNQSSLNLYGSNIMVGADDDAFDYDVVLSVFDSVFDEKDIINMLWISSIDYWDNDIYNTFSVQAICSGDGKPAYFPKDTSIRIMIPVNKTMYKNVNLCSMNGYDISEIEYDIITYDDNYYLFFEVTDYISTYIIQYKQAGKHQIVSHSTYSAQPDNVVTDVNAVIDKNTPTPLKVLVISVLVVLCCIICFNTMFLLYFRKMNKIISYNK